LVRIREDRSSPLDATPAQYRVIETVRPRPRAWPRRPARIIRATPEAGSSLADEILARVAASYVIEVDIRGNDASVQPN
jgi:hypothetical protein